MLPVVGVWVRMMPVVNSSPGTWGEMDGVSHFAAEPCLRWRGSSAKEKGHLNAFSLELRPSRLKSR